MATTDPRSRIPRTDDILRSAPVEAARASVSEQVIRDVIAGVQQRARNGEIAPEQVESGVAEALARRGSIAARPVLNATGVVIHTNLGRAPLSEAAVEALVTASGYVDVELDLVTGSRSKRGMSARAALLRHCAAAQDALIVNNGAAALVLATTTFAAGAEVIVSRGELIEIGAGFRLTDLIESTGARLREVGTTNRTHLRDYVDAIGPQTGCILKVHPSNFRVQGFTAEVDVAQLRSAAEESGIPIVADLGSGLLQPDSLLPDEPDATSALQAGADIVTASGDKLLGGPQAGLVLGRSDLVARMARHPLARAVRADKLALAALEATLDGPQTPVGRALHADADRLEDRAHRLAAAIDATVVAHDGRVGGGGAPGVPLPGWAVAITADIAPPTELARRLRTGDPAVVPRLHEGVLLLDLRCIPEADDARLADAVRMALKGFSAKEVAPAATPEH